MKSRVEKYWLVLVWIGMWISSICIDYAALDEQTFSVAVLVITAIIVAIMLLLLRGQKDTWEMVVTVILVVGVWVRFTYCIKMGYHYSNHDLGGMVSGSDAVYHGGHLGYVEYIYLNNRLPDMDPRTVWSFYNPPFYYIAGAIFLKINALFLGSMGQMFENLQLLTMLFATLAIQTGYLILKEFDIRGKALAFAVAILSFHPYFIIGGATPNNDILSVLFIFLTVLYAIRWFKNGKIGDMIKLALVIGLGMMTKLSVGLIAIPVAILFLVKFIKERQWKRYLLQFLLFGSLCIPLGMYWPVRNVYLFNMPLVYVQEVPDEGKNELAGIPTMDRINPLNVEGYESPYITFNPNVSYNMWTALFKTQVFDERSDAKIEDKYARNISWLLLITAIVLSVLTIPMGIYEYTKRRGQEIGIMGFKSMILIVFLASYVKFCIGYPVICSMNFRYVVPIILVAAINVGLFLEDKRVNRFIKAGVVGVIIAFSVSSFYLYGIIRF